MKAVFELIQQFCGQQLYFQDNYNSSPLRSQEADYADCSNLYSKWDVGRQLFLGVSGWR